MGAARFSHHSNCIFSRHRTRCRHDCRDDTHVWTFSSSSGSRSSDDLRHSRLWACCSLARFFSSWKSDLVDKARKTWKLAMFSIILVQSLLIVLYFQKYPIFPAYQSPDYAAHVQYAQGLVSGTSTSIPLGVLYYGVRFQLSRLLCFSSVEMPW